MFQIRQHGSSVAREMLGGTTTFMAMSYILFVQPAMLSQAGMDPQGVMVATCVASALACGLMGLMANLPVALAPGMGHNAFFVFSLVLAHQAMGLDWRGALALTAVSGGLFLLLSLVGFRSRLLNSIPDALKSGIAAGIGLFIALIGLQFGHLVVKPDASPLPVALADLRNNPTAWLALLGLGVTLVLMAWRVRGAILLGILITTAAALAMDAWLVELEGLAFTGLVDLPRGWTTTAGGFWAGFGQLWTLATGPHWAELVTLLFILLFMDLFDTVGTLVGVAHRAGLMIDGRLPRAERALAADAAGTVLGAALGTSTVTSYIESVTGVTEGARTGLAAVTTGALMLVALFFQPLVSLVGGGIVVAPGVAVYPILAAALIVVGAMMMRALTEVNWDEPTEYLPAFLTVAVMPFTYNISHGIAAGFVSYALGKLLTGRPRECPAIVYIFAVLFVLRYALMPVV